MWQAASAFLKELEVAGAPAAINVIEPVNDGGERALVERFREVEITFDAAPAVPGKLPASWMRLSSSAAVVQFIESQFDEQRTSAEIRNLLGEARSVTFTPMSLRSIFLAMAKSGRDAA